MPKTNKIKPFLSLFWALFSVIPGWAQSPYSQSDLDRNYDMLLANPGVQIEATEAINKLYNYKFGDAESEFNWLKYRYPNHPMPQF